MADLYLEALMHGDITTKAAKEKKNLVKKDIFDVAIDKQLEEYLTTLSIEEVPTYANLLFTPEMQRHKIRAELQAQAKLTELSAFLTSAIEILKAEGASCVGSVAYEAMLDDFRMVDHKLNEYALEANWNENTNFIAQLGLSEITLSSLLEIAIAQFNRDCYDQSLALFILLLSLSPENPDYWYRAGIVAQLCKNDELAIRLFTAAIALEPLSIPSRIFSIESYLRCGLQDKAQAAFAEIMALPENSQLDDSWKNWLMDLQLALKKQ